MIDLNQLKKVSKSGKKYTFFQILSSISTFFSDVKKRGNIQIDWDGQLIIYPER